MQYTFLICSNQLQLVERVQLIVFTYSSTKKVVNVN